MKALKIIAVTAGTMLIVTGIGFRAAPPKPCRADIRPSTESSQADDSADPQRVADRCEAGRHPEVDGDGAPDAGQERADQDVLGVALLTVGIIGLTLDLGPPVAGL